LRRDRARICARSPRGISARRRWYQASRDVYDSYLKANRVEEGIASYDAVVRLMLGTEFETEGIPRLRSR
jgi:hypothetical protein